MRVDIILYRQMLKAAMERIIGAQDELTGIDSRFGDADHGVTMSKISRTVLSELEAYGDDSIAGLTDEISSAVMLVNGGSAGPLWTTLFEGMAKYAPKGPEVGEMEFKAMMKGAVEALGEITTAGVGDKTMMDTLIPAVEAIDDCDGDFRELLSAGSEAAKAGAAKSAEFAAKFGRAKSYKEQTIGTPDAGAVSMQYFFMGLYEGIL